VDEGFIKVGDYKRVKISIELYKSSTRKIADNSTLEHEWVYGDPGVGKSRYARE